MIFSRLFTATGKGFFMKMKIFGKMVNFITSEILLPKLNSFRSGSKYLKGGNN